MVAALSPSRASDFMQCPLLYRFRVIDRLPEPPSAAASRGTLVHAVLERLFDLPAAGRTLDAARTLVAPQWAAMVEQDPALAELVGEGENAGAPDVEAWLEQAMRLVERWFTMEDPQRLEPAERELYVETMSGDLMLRGYIDRLDVAPNGMIRVVDYKTGRSPAPAWEGKALFQMKFYALAIWRLRGVVPAMLQLVYLGNGEFLRYQPTEDELLATERKLQALWAAIRTAAESGQWQPKTSRLCDWCAHQALCPAWGGTPPPIPADALARAMNPARRGGTDPRTAGTTAGDGMAGGQVDALVDPAAPQAARTLDAADEAQDSPEA